MVGAGAAGILAAIKAAENGARVLLLEKMAMPGRKLMITGKGRCNITNACDMRDMIPMIPGNGKFLFGAFHTFTNRDIMELLEENGLPVKVERGGRVFPQSDRALDVVDTLKKILRKKKVELRTNTRVRDLVLEGGRVTGVVTGDGRTLAADAVVASFLVGPEGKVVGLEASPVLYWAVSQGLKTYAIDDPDITASLRRIQPRLGKAEELLPTFPADSFDVVYFDPMFRNPVGNSASMQPLRPASYHKPLDPSMIREALRLAPRVVVKERDEDLLRSLGAREIQGGKYSKLRYGIIRREEGAQ